MRRPPSWRHAALALAATLIVLTCTDPPPAVPLVESIVLSTDSLAIQFRDSATEVSATTLGHLGVEIQAPVTWRSKNTDILDVVQDSNVARLIPKNIGQAEIEATSQAQTAVAKVTVLDTVYAVVVTASDTIVSKGMTLSFSAAVDGPPSASTKVVWSVQVPRIAEIDSSAGTNPVMVRSLDTGSTEIIATSAIDGARKGSALLNTARPTRLVFTLQPPDAQTKIYAQNTMSPGPRVLVHDALGNPFAGTTDVTIGLTPETGTTGAGAFGTLIQATQGLTEARFDDIGIDRSGAGYTLTATSGNLIPAISSPFTVIPECDGTPYQLGTRQTGTLGPSSCEPIPGNFYDRFTVTSSTQQYFKIRMISSFGARHSVVDPLGGLNPIRGDSAYYVVGPGTFDLRAWSSSVGATGPYEILTETSPGDRPAGPANINASLYCLTTHISRNVSFEDELRCSAVTYPASTQLTSESPYRLIVPANKSVTITMTSTQFDPYLDVFLEGTDEHLRDDNSGGGTAARVTISAATRERTFGILAFSNPPGVLRNRFTLIIQ